LGDDDVGREVSLIFNSSKYVIVADMEQWTKVKGAFVAETF
jgi:hypothetical protein